MMRGIVVNNLRLSSGVIVFKKPKPSLLLSLRTIQRNMSSESISKLPDLARSLVENILGQNQASGLTEGDKVLVDEWVGKASSGSWSESSLKDLDATLSSKTYLVGSGPSAADIALYAVLHPVVLPSSKYYSFPSVTRYFDHIQNLPNVRTASSAPPVVPLDIENAPKVERKAEAPKKKAKKEADTPNATKLPSTGEMIAAATSSPPTDPTAPSKEKKEKKPKKETTAGVTGDKSSGKKAAPPAAAAADAGEPSPAMIDLRVGHIVDVKKHPDADGLYVEQIDLGEETGPRTIVSGLVNYIPIEQMQGKYLIVVANLKPASMRGVKSFGMVLCATSKEGKSGGIEIVDPPQGSKPGDRVFFEGEKYENVEPVSQLNPKKKIFETIQPGFITLESREAAWVDPATNATHRIMTKLGPCTAPTFVGASLS